MDWTQRNEIRKEINGYDWHDMEDKQTDFWIGASWQAGLGHGKRNNETIYYLRRYWNYTKLI